VLDGSEAGETAVANSSGVYTFDSLTTGNTNFSVTASLYQDTRAGVAVDGTNTLNFTMTRATVPLGGSVTASTGERIVGATVTVLDGVNTGDTAVTDSAGDYRFASLTTGNVNFKTTASGYFEKSQGTSVDGTNSLNFTLTPVPAAASITITAELISGGTGAPLQEWRFTATTNQTFATYNWDFGDGAAATGLGAERGLVQQHLYTTKATRTVTVTGVYADGTTLDGTLEITID